MFENYQHSYKTFLLLEKSLSANTLAAYQYDLRFFEQFLREKYPDLLLKDLELHHFLSFVESITEEEYALASQARMASSLKSFFNFSKIDFESIPTKSSLVNVLLSK